MSFLLTRLLSPSALVLLLGAGFAAAAKSFSPQITPGPEVPRLPDSYTLNASKPREDEQSWQKGRSYHLSSKSPMARVFQSQADALFGIYFLLAFFRKSELRMGRLLKDELNPSSTNPDKGTTCNVPCDSRGHFHSARYALSIRGWGKLPTPCCVTELEDDKEENFFAMERLHEGVNKVARKISNEIAPNWTFAGDIMKFKYSTEFQDCQLHWAAGYRVDGHWSLGTTITSRPVSLTLLDWDRHYITEPIVVKQNGRLGGFPSYARMYKNGNGTKQPYILTTTAYSTWGFKPTPSDFGNYPVNENTALQAALARFEHLNGQAEDSTTISNILVLAFPVLMVLVPISLISDVSKGVAIAYAIGTDIWAALPLAVKGVELIHLAHRRHYATRTHVFGMRDNTSLGVAQTWAAQCSTTPSILTKGALFLASSLLGTIVGLSLEVFAYKVMKRRRANALKFKLEQYPNHALQYPFDPDIYPLHASEFLLARQLPLSENRSAEYEPCRTCNAEFCDCPGPSDREPGVIMRVPDSYSNRQDRNIPSPNYGMDMTLDRSRQNTSYPPRGDPG